MTEQLVVQTVRTNGSNTQSWTFEGLPKQNLYNNPYTYTVTEESVDGYTASDVTLAGGTETRCAVTSTVILRVRCDQHAYARNHDIERGQDVG